MMIAFFLIPAFLMIAEIVHGWITLPGNRYWNLKARSFKEQAANSRNYSGSIRNRSSLSEMLLSFTFSS